MATIDPDAFLERERRAWASVSDGWRKWWSTFEGCAQSLSDRLVALAGLEAGQRVLDIATGIGEPALTAARRVGPTGRVVATDLSPEMLSFAAERARTAGIDHVEFLERDARELKTDAGSFDAALCRWGLMLMLDPVAVAREVCRALRPGGRFATAVWSARQHAPFLALPVAVMQRELDVPAPDPDAPGPFRLCRPEQLRRVLEQAGFAEVAIEEQPVTMSFASTAEYATFIGDMSSSMQKTLSEHPEEARQRVFAGIEEAARPHTDAGTGRVELENRCLCAVATAP